MLSLYECHNQSFLFKVFWNLYSLFEKKGSLCEHNANTSFSYNRGNNNLTHDQNTCTLLEMVLAVKVICVGMQVKVFQMDAIKKEYYS